MLDWDKLAAELIEPDVPAIELLLAKARQEHVKQLFVAGREIVRDGAVTGVDLPALEAELLATLRQSVGNDGRRSRGHARTARRVACALLRSALLRVSAACPCVSKGFHDPPCASSIASPPMRPTTSAASRRRSRRSESIPQASIAVLAKTEGNGLVNDFSRGHATLALSLLFQRHLPAQEAARICLVMSGGTEGAMAPHWLVFERRDGEKAAKPALAIGRAHTAALPFEHLGRLASGRSGGGRRARRHG